MITHLHIKSGDDSLNGIAVIGRTIFVFFPRNCWKSIPAKLMPPYIRIKSLVITFPLIDRTSSKCWVSRICGHFVSSWSLQKNKNKQSTCIMITHLHVKSGDDSSNDIAVNWSNNMCGKLVFRNGWKSIPAKLLTPYTYTTNLVMLYT